MRTILLFLALVTFFIVTLPAYLILLLLRKYNKRLSVKISQVFVNYGFRFVLFFAGTKRKVIGVENVPKDQAVLYVANHRSYADIPLAYITLPTLTGFIAKKEIEKVPFLSWWMKNLNCLFLDRDDLKAGLKTILQGIDYIKDGYSMFIAPEGTRNHGDELLPFKEGSLKMAQKTGCLIIPVAITGSDDVFEKHVPWVRRANTIIEYGKPINIKELPPENQKFLGAYMREVITEMLANHKQLEQ